MRILTLLASLLLASATDAYETSYQTRLDQLSQLARKFPGYATGFGFRYREQGLWAGNTIQTKWQLNSGRAHRPIWKWVNFYLTSAPFSFSGSETCDQNSLVGQLKSHESSLPITIEEVCEEWKKFFQRAQTTPRLANASERRLLRTLFWSAHESSIQYALWRHEEEMLENRRSLPAKEWNYWANWLGVVEYLQKLNFPTTDSLIYPIVQLTGPRCAPLGEPSCERQIAGDAIRREYTAALGNLTMDLEDVRAGHWDTQVIENLALRLITQALAQTL